MSPSPKYAKAKPIPATAPENHSGRGNPHFFTHKVMFSKIKQHPELPERSELERFGRIVARLEQAYKDTDARSIEEPAAYEVFERNVLPYAAAFVKKALATDAVAYPYSEEVDTSLLVSIISYIAASSPTFAKQASDALLALTSGYKATKEEIERNAKQLAEAIAPISYHPNQGDTELDTLVQAVCQQLKQALSATPAAAPILEGDAAAEPAAFGVAGNQNLARVLLKLAYHYDELSDYHTVDDKPLFESAIQQLAAMVPKSVVGIDKDGQPTAIRTATVEAEAFALLRAASLPTGVGVPAGWVPIEERRPEYGDDVWVAVSEEHQWFFGKVAHGRWLSFGLNRSYHEKPIPPDQITHWMPYHKPQHPDQEPLPSHAS